MGEAAETVVEVTAGAATADKMVPAEIKFGLLRTGPDDAAETLVFLHGWAGSKELWRHTLALLPPHCRAFALDLPGTGQTPLPPGMQTIPQMAAWVAEVCRRLGLEDITLIGHSLGGNLAAEVALLFPELVGRLVMVDAALDPNVLPVRARWPLRRPFGLGALAVLRLALAPLALAGCWVPAEVQVGFWRGQARRAHWYLRANPSDRALRVQLQALSDNPVLAARLAGLSLPILILHGEKDIMVPSAEARALAQTLCHARLVIFPHGHHSPMDTNPTEFVEAIAGFCLPSGD